MRIGSSGLILVFVLLAASPGLAENPDYERAVPPGPSQSESVPAGHDDEVLAAAE